MGGGISSVSAVELSTICTSGQTQECKITNTYQNNDITNNTPLSTKFISIETQIGTFTNNSTLTSISAETFSINNETDNTPTHLNIKHLINNKNISGYIKILTSKYMPQAGESTMTITNYGTMGGIKTEGIQVPKVIIDNRGVINMTDLKDHFRNTNVVIRNYAMTITESANVFNSFDGTNPNNSHLIANHFVGYVEFENDSSKMILRIGDGFELGMAYFLDKLIVDTQGENKLKVDFSRLELGDKDLYTLVKSGDNAFIVNLIGGGGSGGGSGSNSIILHTPITELYKSNIHTMNNFYTMSNSMIYPRKSYHSQNLGKKNQNNLVILRERSDRRISKSNIRVSSPKAQNDNIMQDSANPLKSYESFAYRNESVNRRIQRQNKRNYSRTKRNNNNSVILSESEESQKKNNRDSSPKAQNDNGRKSQNQTFSQNLSQNLNYSQTPHNYYFILTPFLNYNSFTQSGNYNLSGFDYGFLTAFSAQVAESNNTISSLGAHFIFSYGSLGDSKDKDLSIKSLNLNVGINYKLDLIYDMYLKARGDFYYFSNTLDSLTIKNIKPNNLGFGASVIFGKDFNFGKGGVLGIEAGIDYKALQSNTISLQNNATKTISETYKKSLYNLIYVDLGMSYNKYFGNFGLNATLGIKGNITANKLSKSQIHISTFNKSVDMVLDNDNFLGYANLGASYVLSKRDFDMEFSLAYYGNYGDRVISNGGGVEWRVLF